MTPDSQRQPRATSSSATSRAPLSDAGGNNSLTREHYHDGELFRREQRELLANRWLLVGREAELARPGDYRCFEVAGQSLVAARTEDGWLRCHHNVCRHRGAQLCHATLGAAQRFTCPYHGWAYSLDGDLLAAPQLNDVPGFSKRDYPLHSVAIDSWRGFLFVHLGPAPLPLASWLAPLDRLLAPWPLETLLSGWRQQYDVRANWKLICENFNECYHCPRVHPRLQLLSPAATASNALEEGPILGGPMDLAEGVESLTTHGRRCGQPLLAAEAPDARRVHYYTLFPNCFLSPHPDYVMTHRLEPLAVDRTRVVCELLFSPETLERDGFEPAAAAEFWDQTNRQDWAVCESCQRGTASWSYQAGPYSGAERIVAAWDRHYLTALQGGSAD